MHHIARLRLATLALDQGDLDWADQLLTSQRTGGFESRYDELRGDIFAARNDLNNARNAYQSALENAVAGSVAAQIAKIRQCHTIGIAGGPDKCTWLREELGLDGTIDYKSEHVDGRLTELCPNGINVFFDNVGGNLLEVVLDHMSTWGRIVCCGMISGYNADRPQAGPENLFRLITRRVRMEGFLVPDYAPRFKEARRELSAIAPTVNPQLLHA